LGRRVPQLLKEARDRDDLYAVTSLTLVVGTFVRLAADEPQRARRDIAQVMARWSREGFHVQHLEHAYDEAQIDIYRGEGQTASDRLDKLWPTLEKSHVFRVQQVRIYMRHLRARSALAAAAYLPEPAALLHAARRDADLLNQERVPWAEALASLIQAGAATIDHGEDSTALLRQAAAALDAVDMPLYAAAARRQLGRLVGGDAGQALIAHADAWMQGQKIQKPARMSALLAPGKE
jgi:hypothetical protein